MTSYIPEENQRLRMYKRIAGAEDYATLTDVRAELQDRYGTPTRGRHSTYSPRARFVSTANSSASPSSTANALRSNRAPAGRLQSRSSKCFTLSLRGPSGRRCTSHRTRRSPCSPEDTVDPGVLMKPRQPQQRSAAPSSPPQGILRWPLTSAKAEDVLAETRALLDSLDVPHRTG